MRHRRRHHSDRRAFQHRHSSILRLLAACWPGAQSARDNDVLACNFAKYLPNLKKSVTHRLSNKPFLIWLLKTSPQLECVAALPCNSSLVACFADINVSQGSVATYARCDGIFDIHLTANLPRNLPVKVVFNRLRFDRSMVTSLWPSFFGPLCSRPT